MTIISIVQCLMTKLHPRENYIRRLTYHEAIMTALHLICISEATDHRGRTLFTMSTDHCNSRRWSSSPLWNVAVTSRVAVTRVAAYGGWPYYGMVTIHAYWVRMAWYVGILACTWSSLTIASLARNWFWDGNCNCLLCLCTPLPTPSTHIRYMYQFDKHFSGPPKPNMKRKNFEAWLNIPPLTENTGHHMP